MTMTGAGNVGIGTHAPQAKFDINGSSIIVEMPHTPASSSEACIAGAIEWDASFVYVCTAANTFKRSALSAF